MIIYAPELGSILEVNQVFITGDAEGRWRIGLERNGQAVHFPTYMTESEARQLLHGIYTILSVKNGRVSFIDVGNMLMHVREK